MKIVLSGVETNNKGAELMLYAILQEIERKYPKAVVYLSSEGVKQGISYIHTSLDLRFLPFGVFVKKAHLLGIFRRLHLPSKYLQDIYGISSADFFIDASGFHFSDQKKNFTPEKVWKWERLLKRLNKQGCKIVFLPQAFGPVSKVNTIKGLKTISRYSNLIIPREQVSYNYLSNSKVVDMSKVRIFSDFTSLVEGVFPSKYEHLRGAVCIIPNLRMIDTGAISKKNYIDILSSLAKRAMMLGYSVFLLNHEGKKDEQLAFECRKHIGKDVEVVTGLNALEVKGIISSSYLVVTSRFHGLASALNSCVPALATSWSHKYEELYRDYKLEGFLLPLDNAQESVSMFENLLEKEENTRIRQLLSEQVKFVKAQTRTMWNLIWAL